MKRRVAFTAIAAAIAAAAAGSAAGAEPAACPRCGWKPPEAKAPITVRPGQDLARALAGAGPEATVLLEDGEYRLERMADIPFAGLVLRGRSGDASKVVIRGGGMTEKAVGVALSVSAPGVVLADLTVGNVGYHGIQVRGEAGASKTVIHGVRVVDTGQQLLKGSLGSTGRFADDCLVACSYFGYTDSAPSDYTNGVDVLGGKGWVVRDCELRNVRGPKSGGWKCGPAILFWANSQESLVERNRIIDCFRGIAFGLGPGANSNPRDGEKKLDHKGGVIRQNVIVNLNPWADEAIEANGAPGVRIEHNSVLVEGGVPWSISVRFSSSSGAVRNNLTNKDVVFRDGGMASLANNVSGAKRDWFADASKADLRLRGRDVKAVDAAQPVPGLDKDFDGKPRTSGRRPDAGAFEHQMK